MPCLGQCGIETVGYDKENCSGQSSLTLAALPASCSVWQRDDSIGRGAYRGAAPQRWEERTEDFGS